jgi:hypothetical protein
MASSDKPHRLDFNAWSGVAYVVDAEIEPDKFFFDPVQRIFHIGAGTDLQLRLFYLNLTENDLTFLRGLHVSLGNQ